MAKDLGTVTRQAQRNKELAACMVEVQKVLEKYDATFNVARVVTVGADGIERSQMQVQTASR